jgi:hypothetical protein
MAKRVRRAEFLWIAGGSLNAQQYTELSGVMAELADEGDPDAADELQLDPLIDSYANRLFPWTSVLIAEPKYYFFALAVVEALVTFLRHRRAGRWKSAIRAATIERSLRFVETCICAGLAHAQGRATIIGIRRWGDLWVTPGRRLTRESVVKYGGIQKSVGMHPTPRYFGKAAVVLGGDWEGESVLGTIEQLVTAEFEPEFPWRDDPEVGDIVAGYAKRFCLWLAKPPKNPKLAIELTESERLVLRRYLFGGGEHKESHHDFLARIEHKLRKATIEPGTISSVLAELQNCCDGKLREQCKQAATILRAVALVRLCYRSLLATAYESHKAAAAVDQLAKVKLRDGPDDEQAYSKGGRAFLRECIAAANKSPAALALTLYRRERRIKGDRRKLYNSAQGVRVKPAEKFTGGSRDPLQYREPAFRMASVKRVLERLQTLRKVA